MHVVVVIKHKYGTLVSILCMILKYGLGSSFSGLLRSYEITLIYSNYNKSKYCMYVVVYLRLQILDI